MSLIRLENEVKTFNPLRSLIVVLCTVAITYLLSFTVVDQGGETLGIWSCLPAVFMVVYVFATKRVMEALFLAALMGAILCHPDENVVLLLSSTTTDVMMDEDTGWLIVVCGLMGSLICLIEKAGGAFAFGEWAAKRAKSRKSSLMWTWFLGVAIFIDDYLNSLTIGSCMKRLTDKYGVSREMLSYVTSSTAAPLCVLIPISTWAVFAGRVMVQNGWGEEGSEIATFARTIPFNFYGWIAAILVVCVIWKIVPVFGPMKKAEERVANGGPSAPPDSGDIDISNGMDENTIPDNPKVINLFIPIFALISFTLIFDIDMQVGIFFTLLLCYILFIGQKLMTSAEYWDCIVNGIKNMILPLLLCIIAYVFAAMNEEMGFTKYVIDLATAHISPQFLPVVVFCALAVTEFITGTNWGMFVIALPIIIPLAINLAVPLPLACAAVLSAGVLGAHCCFYSDCTVITSAATGCNNFQHAWTQMPYGLLAGGISAIFFLVCGLVMV